MLLNLSNELLHEAISYLEKSNLKDLRLTSSRLSLCAEAFLFDGLTFELLDEHPSRGSWFYGKLNFLRAIAKRKTTLGRHIKRISISATSCGYMKNGRFRRAHNRLLSIAGKAPRTPVELLADAAPYLPSLCEIQWDNCHYSLPSAISEAVHKAFMALAAHCPINRLSFSIFKATLPSLDMFSSIEHLDVSGVMYKETIPAFSLTAWPALRTLHLCARTVEDSWSVPYSSISIEDILYQPHAPSLSSLSLSSIILSIDSLPLLIPLLSNITKLQLSSMSIPDEFWNQLRNSNIVCRELHLQHVEVTPTILRYISSCVGLVELFLRIPDPEELGTEPYLFLGQHFWANVLPNHSSTIRYLSVLPVMRVNSWCLSETGLQSLTRCKLLTHLNIASHHESILRRLPPMLSRGVVWPQLHVISVTGTDLDSRSVAKVTGTDGIEYDKDSVWFYRCIRCMD